MENGLIMEGGGGRGGVGLKNKKSLRGNQV